MIFHMYIFSCLHNLSTSLGKIFPSLKHTKKPVYDKILYTFSQMYIVAFIRQLTTKIVTNMKYLKLHKHLYDDEHEFLSLISISSEIRTSINDEILNVT